MQKARIDALDGLRAFAAFGVVWIHTWSFYSNPSLNIGGVDLYKSVAILGNGVDFFFVISGFCMYLISGNNFIKLTDYFYFLRKRFFRIAPAYYLSIFVYALIVFYNNDSFLIVHNHCCPTKISNKLPILYIG